MIDLFRRKSSSNPQQGRQSPGKSAPDKSGPGGDARHSTIRWLNAFTAISSVALFSVAGAWTASDGAFTGGAGSIARRLTFDAPANAVADGAGSFAAARPFSQLAMRGEVQSALVLTGISGEALATHPYAISPLVTGRAQSFASTRLPLATPVSFSAAPVLADFVADSITVAADLRHPVATQTASHEARRRQEARPEAARPADGAIDPNAPVPDYALVFSLQPMSGSNALLQAISLRAEWRAVIEPLVMNAEPKPTVVDNL
jgi:hypothetical protein